MGLFYQLDTFKSSLFSKVNRPLLKLKLCYFIVYSVWFSVYPYVALISAQVIDYTELAIIYACVPATSILGPIITGFVADKVGNYKNILTFALLLSSVAFLPVLWLESDRRNKEDLLRNNQTNCSADSSLSLSTSSELQSSYTFPILLVVRLLGFYSFDATNFLLDACCITMTKKHGGDFARQKMFTMASMTVVPIVVGALIDNISDYRGFKDYSIAFYISTGMALSVTALIYQLDVQVERNKESVINTAKKIVGMIDVDAFFVAQVVVGICAGWHRSFFPVYVDVELEDSKFLFGTAASVSGVGSMIIYWVAKMIIEKFGAPTTVVFSLMVTCLRFIVYYFLKSPWIIIINESLEGTGGFLSLVAGNYFCATAAPPGMLASLNGLLAAAVYGAGRGLGLTVGSVLTSLYGIRFTYLVFSLLAGATSICYLITYRLLLKKIEQARLTLHSPVSILSNEMNENVEKAADAGGSLPN